ncbi:MAG: hypothetical protein Kow00102_20500 [Spirochaetota bacterium]
MDDRAIHSEHRPWGFYEVLSDTETHKVKRITVYPKKRLSLQRHKKRKEHWFFVSGQGVVTLDKHEIEVVSGVSVDIDYNMLHRVENTGTHNLVYIEVQLGEYFGEDDIERIEDDYGRAQK